MLEHAINETDKALLTLVTYQKYFADKEPPTSYVARAQLMELNVRMIAMLKEEVDALVHELSGGFLMKR